MDPNETLRKIRGVLAQYGDMLDRPSAAEDPELRLPVLVRDLDDWLSRGGTPPEEWREGPDAAGEVAECAHATVVMGRCDDCGTYPHGHYGAPAPAPCDMCGVTPSV